MIKKLTLCGILSAVAIAISSLERFIPVQAIIPLPGFKLGIANCVLIVAMYFADFKTTLAVLLTKCIVVCLLFSGFSSFLYSLTGGLLAVVCMCFLFRYKKFFSVYGISVAGAAAFNLGQITVAALMLGSFYIYGYLPYLLVASVFTGLLTGLISDTIIRNIVRR